MAPHNDIGTLGESLVRAVIGQDLVSASPRGDIRVAGLVDVEVKSARLSLYDGKYPGYQFCIYRPGQGRRGLVADVLVLVCIADAEPVVDVEPAFFVIPAAAVGTRRAISLPAALDAYTGRWAQYRDRWDIIVTAAETANTHRRTL